MPTPSPPRAFIRKVLVSPVKTVAYRNKPVETAIYKEPVDGPVRAHGVTLQGDDQADRTAHGGPYKSVYSFAEEHYPAWRTQFPDSEALQHHGAFGENLTTQGLLEDQVCVGDRYRVGTAELTVTQPRQPCFKFVMKLGTHLAARHMINTGQCGVYYGITGEGELQAGDAITLLDRPTGAITIARLHRLYFGRGIDAATFERAADAPGLIPDWRDWLLEKAKAAG
ncbi:MAG: MOSC domain-containing protein [Planctomycetota bacterium]